MVDDNQNCGLRRTLPPMDCFFVEVFYHSTHDLTLGNIINKCIHEEQREMSEPRLPVASFLLSDTVEKFMFRKWFYLQDNPHRHAHRSVEFR